MGTRYRFSCLGASSRSSPGSDPSCQLFNAIRPQNIAHDNTAMNRLGLMLFVANVKCDGTPVVGVPLKCDCEAYAGLPSTNCSLSSLIESGVLYLADTVEDKVFWSRDPEVTTMRRKSTVYSARTGQPLDRGEAESLGLDFDLPEYQPPQVFPHLHGSSDGSQESACHVPGCR